MCKKELNVIEEPSLNADAEIIWVKLTPINQTSIYVCSYYRPPNT